MYNVAFSIKFVLRIGFFLMLISRLSPPSQLPITGEPQPARGSSGKPSAIRALQGKASDLLVLTLNKGDCV